MNNPRTPETVPRITRLQPPKAPRHHPLDPQIFIPVLSLPNSIHGDDDKPSVPTALMPTPPDLISNTPHQH